MNPERKKPWLNIPLQKRKKKRKLSTLSKSGPARAAEVSTPWLPARRAISSTAGVAVESAGGASRLKDLPVDNLEHVKKMLERIDDFYEAERYANEMVWRLKVLYHSGIDPGPGGPFFFATPSGELAIVPVSRA